MIKIDDKGITLRGNVQSLTEEIVAISVAMELSFPELGNAKEKQNYLRMLSKVNAEFNTGENDEYKFARRTLYGNLEN